MLEQVRKGALPLPAASRASEGVGAGAAPILHGSVSLPPAPAGKTNSSLWQLLLGGTFLWLLQRR